jgi:hypothetical protein
MQINEKKKKSINESLKTHQNIIDFHKIHIDLPIIGTKININDNFSLLLRFSIV